MLFAIVFLVCGILRDDFETKPFTNEQKHLWNDINYKVLRNSFLFQNKSYNTRFICILPNTMFISEEFPINLMFHWFYNENIDKFDTK